jgi:hypothetical protein
MTLIRRKDWGAIYQDGFGDRPLPVSEYWLHHSVTIAPDLVPPFTDDDAAIRTLERIGQQRFGGGISYTYPVTPVGRIYQGVSIDRRGAHTKGHNTVGAAFVLVGDFQTRPPSVAARDAIARQMVEDHRAGKSNRHTLNGGHRDASGNSTDCPGDAAHDAIPDINRRANALWAAGWPNPPRPQPIPTAKDSEMLVKSATSPAVFVTDGLSRRWLPNPAALADYRGARVDAGLPPVKVHEVPTDARLTAAFGPIVGDVPK